MRSILSEITRDLLSKTDSVDIAGAVVRHVEEILETDAVILLDDGGELVPRAGSMTLVESSRDRAVARWVYSLRARRCCCRSD